MIKLTDRLQKIADFIEKGETVADIGTDHGLLPISLWETGKSPFVVLSDINAGPLEKAKHNINKHYPEKSFDVRIGSGISTLKPSEVDAVVIAGMGGLLISEIIGADPELSGSFKKFILQPRNAQDKLRAWLLGHGFQIHNEALVREGKYLCEIRRIKNLKTGKNLLHSILKSAPYFLKKMTLYWLNLLKIRLE